MDTFYFRRNQTDQVWHINLTKNSIRKIVLDWSAYTGVAATTISSSDFDSEGGGVVGISAESDTDHTTLVTLTASEVGTEFVEASATLANGEKLVMKLRVHVEDYETDTLNDYR